MIKLVYDYYMYSDAHNIILGIPTEAVVKGEKKTVWKNVTYHRTPTQALNRLYLRKLYERIGEADGDMQSLKEIMDSTKSELIDCAKDIACVSIEFRDA